MPGIQIPTVHWIQGLIKNRLLIFDQIGLPKDSKFEYALIALWIFPPSLFYFWSVLLDHSLAWVSFFSVHCMLSLPFICGPINKWHHKFDPPSPWHTSSLNLTTLLLVQGFSTWGTLSLGGTLKVPGYVNYRIRVCNLLYWGYAN